ncbi:MAG: UDP-N-acetylglucosamine 2-epimerase [Candidatus Levybacteria bacterium]|nr:UDP-N-acetylglucosamine 2-epimerase [Candidatus Levybacteria bacterium]
MKIGVLSSSRADFGIYLPLLLQLKRENWVCLEIIAFGTHLSPHHGYTITEIEQVGFQSIHRIPGLLVSDDESSISNAYGLVAINFSSFWATHNFDVVLCLGDRYEMSAAIQASIPFRVRLAHIHGGEITRGAIDNIYRDQISLAASIHFTAASPFSERIHQLKGGSDDVIVQTGSLSLEDFSLSELPERKELSEKFGFPDQEYLLVTIHPETMATDENSLHADAAFQALEEICKEINLVISMPNADTLGSLFRNAWDRLRSLHPKRVFLIEHFGKLNYFSAMSNARLIVGNSSSGIIESASFGKYAVNLGKRQEGRLCSRNVVHSPFEKISMLESIRETLKRGTFKGENAYYQPKAVEKIIRTLKTL